LVDGTAKERRLKNTSVCGLKSKSGASKYFEVLITHRIWDGEHPRKKVERLPHNKYELSIIIPEVVLLRDDISTDGVNKMVAALDNDTTTYTATTRKGKSPRQFMQIITDGAVAPKCKLPLTKLPLHFLPIPE
jgi:hypothetical protein